jgi:hypothetical protein
VELALRPSTPAPREQRQPKREQRAPKQQTQRRTGFLRGQFFVEECLRRERYGSRPCELRQDGEVGVKLDALKATNAKRQQDHSCFNRPNSRSTEARPL